MLSIPKPCRENWDEMTSETGGRFCQSCQKNVHDLSNYTRKDAEKLARELRGGLCARVRVDQYSNPAFRPERSGWNHLLQISALGVSALAVQPLAAQQGSCPVQVHAFDPSGAAVPGATVHLAASVSGDLVRKGVTDASGNFLDSPPGGTYELTVEMPGFAPYLQKEIEVACASSDPIVVQAELKISALMGDVVIIGHVNPVKRVWQRAKFGLNRFFDR